MDLSRAFDSSKTFHSSVALSAPRTLLGAGQVGSRERSWGKLPVALPMNYVRGIDVQKRDFERGKWSYLLGEQKNGGWWYYYIYAFLVKTPMAGLVLVVWALSTSLVSRRRPLFDEVVGLAPAFFVFLLVSSQLGFNRYYRCVLPALPFLCVYTKSHPGRSSHFTCRATDRQTARWMSRGNGRIRVKVGLTDHARRVVLTNVRQLQPEERQSAQGCGRQSGGAASGPRPNWTRCGGRRCRASRRRCARVCAAKPQAAYG